MNVESLTEKTEIERLVTLKSAILKEWAANSAPSFTGLIGANGQDSQEIINYFEGRKFHELPFDDSFFCTMTPLYYLSDYSSAYYLGGYIIEAIDRSLHAKENPWAGMDLPVVHCLDMLLRKLNPETARLTKGQKHCISEFLSIVLRHPDFYFCVEVRDELKRAAVAWRSSAEENRVRRAEPPPPPEQ